MDIKWFRCLAFLIIYSLKDSASLDIDRGISVSQMSKIISLSEKFADFVYTNVKSSSLPIINIGFVIPLIGNSGANNELLIIEKTIHKLSNLTCVRTWENYNCGAVNTFAYPYHGTYIYSETDLYVIPIVYGGSINCLGIQLEMMEAETLFNPRAITVFTMLTNRCGHPDSDGRTSTRLLRHLWSHNLFSSSFVMLSTCDSEVTVVTAAKPFSVENPGRTIKRENLKYFRSAFNLSEFSFNSLYQNKIIKDFNGINFILGTSHSPPYVISSAINNETDIITYKAGIDIDFIKMLSVRNNFSFEFFKNKYDEVEAWIKVLPNGTKVGILIEMLKYRIDAGFGGLWPSFLTYTKFDHSPYYTFTSFSWYVREPDNVPSWMIVLTVYPTCVWIWSAIVYFISCVTYSALEWIRSPNRSQRNIKVRFDDFLLINLGLSSPLNPKVTHLRILLLTWIIYSLNWSIVFTTMLFVLESNPPVQKGIHTFEDLYESKLKTGMNTVLIEIFNYVELGKKYREVMENNFVCNNSTSCLAELVHMRNFSILENEAKEYQMNMNRIHRIRAPLLKYPVGLLVNKGNPLSKTLNDLLQRSFQSGLIAKWESSAHSFHRQDHSADPTDKSRSHVLGMSDMVCAFNILVYGLTATFVTFLGEILFNMINTSLIEKKCDQQLTCQIRKRPTWDIVQPPVV